jgi:uncharacterized protein YbjQ (UPF0145 family)
MKTIRKIGSMAFVLGLFTLIFIGMPWYIITNTDLGMPWWLKVAVLCLIGGILIVLLSVALEQKKRIRSLDEEDQKESPRDLLILNSSEIPGREITEILGVVKGHTIFAIWIGNDLSAIVKLVLGGELTEYTDMMGKARKIATDRLIAQAIEVDADAIINLRYMTTSVIGSAAELLAYGTAVKLK